MTLTWGELRRVAMDTDQWRVLFMALCPARDEDLIEGVSKNFIVAGLMSNV